MPRIGFAAVRQGEGLARQWCVIEEKLVVRRIRWIRAQEDDALRDARQCRAKVLAAVQGQIEHCGLALQALAEVAAVMESTESRWYKAELFRLKGTLLLKQAVPDASQAEACFHQALDIARQQHPKSWELRAATSLARLWQQQGKQGDARELLTDVYGWFTEGFDTQDLQEAKALLKTLT
jgi:predicted ATPase